MTEIRDIVAKQKAAEDIGAAMTNGKIPELVEVMKKLGYLQGHVTDFKALEEALVASHKDIYDLTFEIALNNQELPKENTEATVEYSEDEKEAVITSENGEFSYRIKDLTDEPYEVNAEVFHLKGKRPSVSFGSFETDNWLFQEGVGVRGFYSEISSNLTIYDLRGAKRTTAKSPFKDTVDFLKFYVQKLQEHFESQEEQKEPEAKLEPEEYTISCPYGQTEIEFSIGKDYISAKQTKFPDAWEHGYLQGRSGGIVYKEPTKPECVVRVGGSMYLTSYGGIQLGIQKGRLDKRHFKNPKEVFKITKDLLEGYFQSDEYRESLKVKREVKLPGAKATLVVDYGDSKESGTRTFYRTELCVRKEGEDDYEELLNRVELPRPNGASMELRSHGEAYLGDFIICPDLGEYTIYFEDTRIPEILDNFMILFDALRISLEELKESEKFSMNEKMGKPKEDIWYQATDIGDISNMLHTRNGKAMRVFCGENVSPKDKKALLEHFRAIADLQRKYL